MPAPITYLLSQHRLTFLLLGIAISSLTLTLNHLPTSSSSTPPDPFSHLTTTSTSSSTTRRVLLEDHHLHNNAAAVVRRSVAGKVPLGLRTKGLRVVVTGGAGFVGSHLVDRLMERGDSVIVVDNFFTGRKDNVMHHFGNPRFEMIRHDVVEPILLEVDQIYHLACPASPVHYKFNPVKTIISFLFTSSL